MTYFPVSSSRIAVGIALAAALVALQACERNEAVRPAAAKRALIVIDMQYDFVPGGALATPGGDEIVPLINRLQHSFDLIVSTQDWHPPGHVSFASAHPNHKVGETIEFNGLSQELWPDHALQGSRGAQLVADLNISSVARVFRKGMNPAVDSYSGFFDNGNRGDTGLNDYLMGEGVTEVFVVGLALDYCVKYTALDAQRLGYRTTVIVDATRAVNLRPGDREKAVRQIESAGVRVIESGEL